jgi:oligopeptide transport system substrate-binding protein
MNPAAAAPNVKMQNPSIGGRFQEFMSGKARQCLSLAFSIAVCLIATNGVNVAAAELKTIKIAFRAVETGFDPQRIEDRYSVGVCENIFESLLTYDWLARPVKLAPQVVEKVPEGEEGGTRFTFRIKPGILFADDPAFNGKKRELVAKDMEYAVKRFRDPAVRSPYSWLFEDKVVGLDEYVDSIKKTGAKFDYDKKIEGITLVDRYTISFKLRAPDYNFIYFFAMPNVAPVAREVIEKYRDDTMAHPVGTGPYVLKQWVRASKIVLERNPNYRGHTLNTTYANPADPWDQDAVKSLAGKTLPLIDRIEIYPIEQEQPRYLAFMDNQHDYIEETPLSYVTQLLPNGVLAPSLKKRNVRVFREVQPEIVWDAFNMDDPIVGGYKPENVALRRAMVHAHDIQSEINVVRSGQAIQMQAPIGPGVVGYDPSFRSSEQQYDLPRAKALLDMYGYVDRDGDGWREMPDGQPITVQYKYQANEQEQRQRAALWIKSLAAVGIKMTAMEVQFADLIKDRKVGKYQMSGIAWIADYPDAQNFLQLLYGPNINISNDARFKSAEYDKLYLASLRIPDGPERNQLYREMSRVVVAYAPWRFTVHRSFSHFINPWVKGYKKHPILYTSFKYLDVDLAMQKKVMQQ